MKIIGKSGATAYLLSVDGNDKLARVLDTAQGKLFPPFNLQSILKFGYWEAYTGPQEILGDLLQQVEEVWPPKEK